MAARSRRPLLVRILLWVVVFVVVVLLVAEFGLRALISHSVKDEVPGSSISLGSYPLVLSLPTRTVKQVELDVPDSVVIRYPDANSFAPAIEGNPASHIVIHNLKLNGERSLRAGTIDLRTQLHDDYLLAMVQQSAAQAAGDNDIAAKLLQVTGVHTTNRGTVDVQLAGGAVTLTLSPLVKDGTLTFEAVSTSVLGFSLPRAVSEALTEGLASAAANQHTDYRVEDVTVQPNTMNVHLTGTDVPLNANDVPLNGLPQTPGNTTEQPAR